MKVLATREKHILVQPRLLLKLDVVVLYHIRASRTHPNVKEVNKANHH